MNTTVARAVAVTQRDMTAFFEPRGFTSQWGASGSSVSSQIRGLP